MGKLNSLPVVECSTKGKSKTPRAIYSMLSGVSICPFQLLLQALESPEQQPCLEECNRAVSFDQEYQKSLNIF